MISLKLKYNHDTPSTVVFFHCTHCGTKSVVLCNTTAEALKKWDGGCMPGRNAGGGADPVLGVKRYYDREHF